MNEAVLIGVKLLLGKDGNVYLEKVDTPIHQIRDQFEPGDYLALTESMSVIRSAISEIDSRLN